MSLDLNLVYDRTHSDVDGAKEIRQKYQSLGDWTALTATETAQLERGTLTCNTLNRVGTAVKYLATQLAESGYEVGNITVKTYAETDTVTHSDWEKYLSNVQSLREAFYTLSETDELPDVDGKLDFESANTIEKILADIDLMIERMKSAYRRCGTFYAGNNSITLPLKGNS